MVQKLIMIVVLSLTSSLSVAAPPIIPAPPQLSASGYLLMDADSGEILVEFNSRQRLPPASLTKIMTSYIVAEELDQGTLAEDEEVEVSVKAWRTEGSRMFVREGTKVKASDLMSGVIIQSGNDASVALAEHIAGSEGAFADVMNQQAARLGMVDTHFVNATGLPDEDHYTTAFDLALLTVALINDHPSHYGLYSEKYFTYNDIRQPNRNTLLWRDKTVDGVKTGHTEAAGYCLVASAVRDNMRLVSVVMGTQSEEARATESQKLLTYGFRYYETLHLYEAQQSLNEVRVWGGDSSSIKMGLTNKVALTIPRGAKESLAATLDIDRVIKAPIQQGQSLGVLTIRLDEAVIHEEPLVALAQIDEAGFLSRLWDTLVLFILQLLSGDPLKLK